MPFYYDLVRSITASGTPGTEVTHLWGKTIANQQVLALASLSVAARFGTAGGGQIRLKTNTGVVASGGTGQTPFARNPLARSADSIWANDATAITPGTVLTTRMSVGFSQTGGPGVWVAMEPEARVQMMPNSVNPIDAEITSLATTASVTADVSLEIAEGV